MRALINAVIGIVAVALCGIDSRAASTTEPPKRPDHYVFEGRLVYRATGGELVPVVPDTILVGSGDGACQFTLQSPAAVVVDATGRFKLTIAEMSAAVVRYVLLHADGSAGPPTCDEPVSWPCYRFRATGCNDRTLQFSAEPPDAIIEMDCPGRQTEQ